MATGARPCPAGTSRRSAPADSVRPSAQSPPTAEGAGRRQHVGEEADHLAAELLERPLGRARDGTDQQPTVVQRPTDASLGTEDRPQPATEPVTAHRRADDPTDGERDARRNQLRVVDVSTPQRLGLGTAATGQLCELAPSMDPADQADSRVRPLARRALRIARPARVLIRARNPCLRARRRVFGWKVRFTAAPLLWPRSFRRRHRCGRSAGAAPGALASTRAALSAEATATRLTDITGHTIAWGPTTSPPTVPAQRPPPPQRPGDET